MVSDYERVEVKSRSYLLCIVCRRPWSSGYKVCYLVRRAGDAMPESDSKQSLCGPCYKEQFEQVYPGEPVPNVPDNYLSVEAVKGLYEELNALDAQKLGSLNMGKAAPDLLERALQAAKDSKWAETVERAYARISEQWTIDVEMSAPIPGPEDLREGILDEARRMKELATRASALLAETQQENSRLEGLLCKELGCEPEDLGARLREASLHGDT